VAGQRRGAGGLTADVRHLDPRFAVHDLGPHAVRSIAAPVTVFRLDGFTG
jgi:class 3 adenylate cyclase